jgi:tRNA A37 threonylcarbamoyladenosine modification protein TsaB
MTKNAALPYKTVLVIDACERDTTAIALFIDDQCYSLTAPAKAQTLPELIEKLLQEKNLLPANLDSLALIKRPGSVTAIRIGTAVANTLAWLGKKPIIEITAQSTNEALESLRQARYDKVVKTSLPFS